MTAAAWFAPAPTRTLLAVISCCERDGRATVRGVAAESGRSLSTTYRHLERLKRAGLVDWEQGLEATLRPLVEVVG